MTLFLAAMTIVCVIALLAWDTHPQRFPPTAHSLLAAIPLAMIAAAWLVHHWTQRASARDWLKAALLAAAFLFWAANQLLRNPRAAIVCNDIAIALFVLDLAVILAAQPGMEVEEGLYPQNAYSACCCDDREPRTCRCGIG